MVRFLTLLSLAMALVLLVSSRADATLPGTNGRIAFSALGDIYTVMPDGSGLTQVSRPAEDEKFDWFPAWSPDGKRLATAGRVLAPPDAFGNRLWSEDGLEVFDADGSNFTRLSTPSQHFSGDATWSPSGTQIAYDSDYLGSGSIYIVNADGTGAHMIVPGEEDVSNTQPSWSPDGQWIAFVRTADRYGSTDLFLVRPDGTDLHPLLQRPGVELDPNWSPDGSTIAFSGSDPRVDEGPAGWFFPDDAIYTVPAGGGAPRRLTTGTHDGSPVWSPDGNAIAFQRDPGGPGGASDMHVWIMNADGSDPHLLTDLYCQQCDPDWQRVPPFPDPPQPASTPAPVRPRHLPTTRPHPPLVRAPGVIKLAITPARFRWRNRAHVRLRIQPSASSAVAFALARTGSNHILRTVNRQISPGWTHIALTRLTPRTLPPGRCTLTTMTPLSAARASVTFRVRTPD